MLDEIQNIKFELDDSKLVPQYGGHKFVQLYFVTLQVENKLENKYYVEFKLTGYENNPRNVEFEVSEVIDVLTCNEDTLCNEVAQDYINDYLTNG